MPFNGRQQGGRGTRFVGRSTHGESTVIRGANQGSLLSRQSSLNEEMLETGRQVVRGTGRGTGPLPPRPTLDLAGTSQYSNRGRASLGPSIPRSNAGVRCSLFWY